MNYRKMATGVIIFTIIIGLIFSNIEIKPKRYHQHLEAKVRAEDVVTKDEFATHLPIIDIKTEKPIPSPHKYIKSKKGEKNYVKNYDVVKSTVKYIQNENKENKRSDNPVFITNSYIRTRGNSSRHFDKKGYLLKFKNKDYTKNRDIEIDGMVADSDWVLHGPHLDKTLIRNYISYNIAGEIMDYAPNVRFCELFINDDYKGLYLLVEKIGYNKDGRINITKSDPNLSSTSYIIRRDRKKESNYNIDTIFEKLTTKDNKNISNEIIYPNRNLTKQQKDFIEKDLWTIEKSLMSSDFKSSKNGYKNHIDVESFIKYFIINEISTNTDAGLYSTYMYKDLRGKIKPIVWDFNSAYNNYEEAYKDNEMFMIDSWWYQYLGKDKYFTNKVINEYKYLRKNILSDRYLIEYIDETIKYLGPAINRNYKRWPNTLKENRLQPITRNQHKYDEAVAYLKKEIVKKGKFLDKNIDSLKYFSHNSTTKGY